MLFHFPLLTIVQIFLIHLGMLRMMMIFLGNQFCILHQKVTQSMMTILHSQKVMKTLMMFWVHLSVR